jgi:Crp-like helix-turn-helix domain
MAYALARLTCLQLQRRSRYAAIIACLRQVLKVKNGIVASVRERHRDPPEILRSPSAFTSVRRGRRSTVPEVTPTNGTSCSQSQRKFILDPDGRQHIVDFLLPGDLFGLTARDDHLFGVEALREGLIACYHAGVSKQSPTPIPRLGRLLREISVRVVPAPGYTCARTDYLREEGGSFLIEMEQRLSAKTAEAVALPMSCYNIADYLGLSVETVSRALTGLKHRGRDQGLSRASFALLIAVRWNSASQTETSGMVAWHTGNVR